MTHRVAHPGSGHVEMEMSKRHRDRNEKASADCISLRELLFFENSIEEPIKDLSVSERIWDVFQSH